MALATQPHQDRPVVSLRTQVNGALAEFPPSMRRIADRVLSDPMQIRDHTITELARSCQTSEATVVRFCRALGLRGYAQLRLLMASELATEAAQRPTELGFGEDIGPADSLSDTVAKIAHNETLAISETVASLDIDALARLVADVDASNRVVVFGVGASGLAAQDLAQKLLRIDRIALSTTDAHDALVMAALLQAGDVAVVFSHSGETREPQLVLEAARSVGARTAAVTNVAGSTLGAMADVVLQTAVRETTFRSGAMASRIAQLTVVDYLFVGVAKLRFEETVRALRTTRDSVQGLRHERRTSEGRR